MNKTLREIFSKRTRPLESAPVRFALFFVLYPMPLSILLNDLVYAVDGLGGIYADTFYTDLFSAPEFAVCLLFSVGVAGAIWIRLLEAGRAKKRYPDNLLHLAILTGWYLITVHTASFVLFDRWPTASSVGLSIVHLALLAILARRLTAPLVPDLQGSEHARFYTEAQKHFDRLLTTFGVGLIVTVLLTITPDGSGIQFRTTTTILLGPITLLLASSIAVGIVRLKRINERYKS